MKCISAMSRYLLPPMSKTTWGARKSAVLNDCFTSAKLDQLARGPVEVRAAASGSAERLDEEIDRDLEH